MPGSMNDDGKISNLKTAATTLVNILTGGANSAPKLWMGVVPFSQAVNIGTEPAALIIAYVVDQGRPLKEPWPPKP